MRETTSTQKLLFLVVAVVTAAFSIFSAVLMTEPGQSLNLPRSWVITYFQYRWFFIAINFCLLAYLWYLHIILSIWSKFWMSLASIGVIICIIAANFLLTAFFPSYQYDADYVSITEADKILSDNDVIYAVEINGEVRGYPREHLEVPHIAGDNIGGKDVVMTFCALSNLPVVIEQDIGFGQSDLGILIQTHNNLVMVDRNSGELIQQITRTPEFSEAEVVSHPNTMTTWKSFKELYPQATVFIYEFNRVVDSLLLALFEGPMEKQFSNEHGAIFPTLDMDDNRLPPKEQVWGFDLGNTQAAFTRAFAQKNPIYRFELEGQPLVLVYDEKHDIVNLFDGALNNTLADFESIDFRGTTEIGQLNQLPMHNGVFWMVWSHWYPSTQVFN
ncbi:DUF3179 domain-containing (seleno)protein [Photobacterium chitinilyticum]|uniref:DUF3179 domain-containing protein n=1 Tax=Photobacterium chitinilyticum TaxID=2485123 RepID=A0A3S3R1Q2_9GAMM|nr:DUF3179 domain-containing (seleno)protein [Photobacterium chitinilyticum]RWX55944.1 DUF3179 domain-containing protein [Photobacterium chitinilyticum]